MKAYFIRRLLLVPLTLIGITLLVFSIVRLTPGGPVEQALSQQAGGEHSKRSGADAAVSLTPAQVLEIEEDYHRDKGIMRSYLEWLGVLPRDLMKEGKEFREGEDTVKIALPGTVHEVTITRHADNTATLEAEDGVDLDGWEVRILTPEYQAERWDKWVKGLEMAQMPDYRAVLFRPGFRGLLQGSLGESSKYQDPVGSMILQRLPVSLFFGGCSMILVYAICLPLGIVKAIRHRSWLDNFTSVAVFTGYAVPGYALGALLVVYLAAKMHWFALGGFVGDQFAELSLLGKIKDLAYHCTLPLICYVISSFAMMTMMMKNNLMDNLAADFIRTAIAKGTSFRRAVFRHAFRNSIIPIATTFGANLSIFVAGSILIEKIFDINGFGLL
ncbi:MAG: ABC transporter permease subunit, partial [Verrucomicrobiales bacterium]